MTGKIISGLVLVGLIITINLFAGFKGNNNNVMGAGIINLFLLVATLFVMDSISRELYQGRPARLSQLPQDGIYFQLNGPLPSDSWHKNERVALVREEREDKIWLVVSEIHLPQRFYLKHGKPEAIIVEPQAQPEQPA